MQNFNPESATAPDYTYDVNYNAFDAMTLNEVTTEFNDVIDPQISRLLAMKSG